MNHFHITLPSDSSLAYYPNNTVARFTTKLSQPIYLTGEYEVGLSELIFPHSWYNLDNSTRQYWVGVKPEGREVRHCYLKSGYYTDGTVLANELTKQYTKVFADIADFSVKFSFNVITNKFMIDVLSKSQLYMSSELQKLLGVVIGTSASGNQTVFSQNVFELNRGLNLVYIYCDIIAHRQGGYAGTTAQSM